MVNVANLVTLGRVALALISVLLLWQSDDKIRWLCFGLTALVIYLDALDGYLARKLKLVSTFGAKLDIAGDRAVEMTYWIAFSVLQWLPIWVPLLFLVRGNLVDVIRAQASDQGFTPFGTTTMMQSGLGKLLVSSNFSRFTYAIAKALAFCLIIAARTTVFAQTELVSLANFFVYLSCFFCVMRALPVFIEGNKFI